jgi:ectoine hydroxylase-related dioxygenase (phytanoyl-CoA dioxygenase family)
MKGHPKVKDLLRNQLEELLERFSPLIENFEIPEYALQRFKKFKSDYYDNPNIFFDKVKKLEIEVFPAFSKIIKNNNDVKDLQFINSVDIDNFLSGNIILKTLLNKKETNILKEAITSVLNSSYEAKHPKLLHLLIPDIVKTLFASNIITETAIKFLSYPGSDISFELGFFSIKPGHNSVNWHDDYSLFCNKTPKIEDINKRLILNFHIALTDVKSNSSPISFIKGTESLVYARSATKYFKDNGIKFDKNIFLKAIFLTENLYKPRQEIKPNFLGLLPALSYRLHQIKNLNQELEIFFKELNAGMVQIFSPHIWHTSPFINESNIARESLVLRFFVSSDYHNTNLITIQDLITHLSFAKSREVGLEEINAALFKQENLSLGSQVYTNIYMGNKDKDKKSKYFKIYVNDLYNFFIK